MARENMLNKCLSGIEMHFNCKYMWEERAWHKHCFGCPRSVSPLCVPVWWRQSTTSLMTALRLQDALAEPLECKHAQ